MMFVSSPLGYTINFTNGAIGCDDFHDRHAHPRTAATISRPNQKYSAHEAKLKAAGNHNSEQTQFLKGSAGEKKKKEERKVMGHDGRELDEALGAGWHRHQMKFTSNCNCSAASYWYIARDFADLPMQNSCTTATETPIDFIP